MKQLIGFFLVALSLVSCLGRTARGQEDGDTLRLKYSSLLTIVRHDRFTEVSIRNPWKEGRTLHTYILVPGDEADGNGETALRGTSQEPALPQGTVIRTPVRRAAVFTTMHCALLEALGHADDIVAVADLEYIKIPYLHQRAAQGKVADCGNGMNPVVEKIMDVKPAIVMLSPFENSGGYGKLEDIGIPLVECAEYMESSPLARAEWMKFYGMLFGEEHKTDSLFAVVDSSYHALCRQAREAGRGCSLLVDKLVGSVWYVPGGRSTIGQMVKDAGGNYPWAADDHSGSLPLTFESVLERGGDTDVWLFRYSSDHTLTWRELQAEHHGYKQLRPFRQHMVYGCNVEQTLFYEETPFRPNLLLSDFLQILHPDMTPRQPLRYFTPLHE